MSPVTWAAMLGAICSEVVATSLLAKSEQFTRPWPTLGMALGYGVAFYLLSIALRQIPVGMAYAMWSGLGVTLVALIGWVFLKQKLDAPALIGLALIVSGVVVMNVFSKSVVH